MPQVYPAMPQGYPAMPQGYPAMPRDSDEQGLHFVASECLAQGFVRGGGAGGSGHTDRAGP